MLAPTRWRFRRPVAAVVAVIVLVLALALVMADRWSKEKSNSIHGNVTSAITTADLTAVALFASYRDTMAALERDFPNVTFIHVTEPLTSEPGLFAELKAQL
jgi:hypothetical protein